MKFNEVVTEPFTNLLEDYIKNHTKETSGHLLGLDGLGRTPFYIGEDVVIIPARMESTFYLQCRLSNRKQHKVQIGNWIIYNDTDEAALDLINRLA